MKVKMLVKSVSGVMVAVLLTACNEASIEGAWVQPVPGMEQMSQGIKIEAGGKASSINMATLQYETWEKKGDQLVLTGNSIGNRQTLLFSDTWTIEKLTSDSLIICQGDYVQRYARGNEVKTGDDVPASVLTPTKKSFVVKGQLIIGHEVRSFVPEGDSIDYWIYDDSDELYQKYDELTKGTKNGKPVSVELEVVDMGKAEDGFAAEYTSVYEVVKVLSMH